MIKHLVLSGGGPTGFISYGALKHLEQIDFWKTTEIQSIYGCSSGSIMGLIISLGYTWEELDDYIIKRPWNKLIEKNMLDFSEIIVTSGFLNNNMICDILEPLLLAKDLTVDVTFKELYEFNHIELHVFSTNMNTPGLSLINISYKTHPDLKVVDGIKMSAAHPFLFCPFIKDDDCFIDGGLINNFPLNECLNDMGCEDDEILAIYNIKKDVTKFNITEKSNLLTYSVALLKKMQMNISIDENQKKIKNIVNCMTDVLDDFSKWFESFNCENMRRELIDEGVRNAKLFYEYRIT